MFRDAFYEFHETLQSLFDIPGALGGSHDAASSQTDTAHRRALRRMDRFLSTTLAEVQWDDLLAMEDDGEVDRMMQEVELDGREYSSMLETLQQDLVLIVHSLEVAPDDPTKRELAESCICAAAQAMVSLELVVCSSDDLVAMTNRLLLSSSQDDSNIPGHLLWILNTQFEQHGVEIRSPSIAVLVAGEMLETITREISEDCLAEDVDSTQRSWCTLTTFMLKFALPPEDGSITELEDLRQWLTERLSEGRIHGDDVVSCWMSNVSQFTRSITNLALDALDMNDKFAIYYATIATQTLVCYGTIFAEELQPSVCRLWTTLVSSYLNEEAHFMETSLQRSVSSLTLDLFESVSKPDQPTTILMFLRALEFPDLILAHDHIIERIPHQSLQCALLTMLRQESGEKILVDRILELLEPTKTGGNLMDKLFWNQVESLCLANEDVEAM